MSLLKYSAKVLKKYLDNRKIIVFNRFTSFGRNIYSQPDFAFFKPDLVFADSDWPGINLPLVFTQEKISKQRFRDTNINTVDVQKIIKNYVKKFKPIFFVWREPIFLRKLALETQGVITAPHLKIKTQIEEKTLFFKILKQAGVSKEHFLESVSFLNSKRVPAYQNSVQKFGKIFVVQGESEGGRGTRIIRDKKTYQEMLQMLEGKIRAAGYFDGQSVNVNVLTVPLSNNQCRVYVALPSIKSTNILEIGVSETMAGGNDWTWSLPRHLLIKFVESAVKIGHYCFAKFGLIGIWGLDSIWQKNNFKFNELNCRLQGTTEASAINQISRGFPPFLVLHALAYLKENLAWLPSEQEFNRETIALGANNKEPRPFYLKIKNKTKWPLKLKALFQGSGIYSKTLKWQKFGMAAYQADFDCNQILLANLPLTETLCYPGAQLCTIEGITKKSHIFCGPHKLCPEAKNLAKDIYKCFKIVNINKHG